jgi:hypothetical protein
LLIYILINRNLTRVISQLVTKKMSEYIWKQISCPTKVADDNFSKGSQIFTFTIGQPYVWVPNKSYFKVDFELTEGTRKPENIVLAENAVACMYNNCYFKAGGHDVSSSADGFLAQVQQAKTRLRTTKQHQDSIGKSIMGLGTYNERQLDISERNVVSRMWQPPIGIFDRIEPVGSGSYSFQLTPNSGFEKSAVESKSDKQLGDDNGTELTAAFTNALIGVVTPATYDNDSEYRLKVKDVKFYICMKKTDVPCDPVFKLREIKAHSTLVANDSTLSFNVPSSTDEITIFLQSGKAGVENLTPPTVFRCDDDSHLNMTSCQVTYANITKPPTRVGFTHNANTNQLAQRYLQTHLESGMAALEGGCETFSEFVSRGPIDHFSFKKSAELKDTQVQVSITCPNLEDKTNIFLLAHYTRITEIAQQSGHITDVKSFNV